MSTAKTTVVLAYRSQASSWQVTPLGRCRISQAQEPAQSLSHPYQETLLHSTDSGQNIYKRHLIFYSSQHWLLR